MSDERRKHERFECYMIARQGRYSRDEEDFFGTVRNISAGGAMIETEERLSIGSLLDLAFWKDEERRVWEGRGEVVWSRRVDEKTFVGLRFTEPLEERLSDSLF